MNKKLYRDEYHRVFGGVCAGLADYFDIDVTIVRLLFVFATFLAGTALLAYIILWVVIPRKGFPYNFNNPTVDYRVPPEQPADETRNSPPPSSNNFGNNPFGRNPFNPPFNQPAPNPAPSRQNSQAAIIIGTVLIVIGGLILVRNFDFIPDIDFRLLWPVMIVIVGLALLVSSQTGRSSRNNNTPVDEQAKPDGGAAANDETTNQA